MRVEIRSFLKNNNLSALDVQDSWSKGKGDRKSIWKRGFESLFRLCLFYFFLG